MTTLSKEDKTALICANKEYLKEIFNSKIYFYTEEPNIEVTKDFFQREAKFVIEEEGVRLYFLDTLVYGIASIRIGFGWESERMALLGVFQKRSFKEGELTFIPAKR